jgi:hypothetical protein
MLPSQALLPLDPHHQPGNYLPRKTPTAQEIKTSTDKWDGHHIKIFCTSKETITSREHADDGVTWSLGYCMQGLKVW